MPSLAPLPLTTIMRYKKAPNLCENVTFEMIHSVEISGFFCHSDFTWNQCLEIVEVLKLPFSILWVLAFVDSISAKTTSFCHFWALEFSSFGKFQP